MADLKLNRFSKRSDRIILEEHSSCEVPAGCGGVVLRWTRPGEPVSVDIQHVAVVPGKLFVDGEPLETKLIRLPVGPHVLGVELEGVPHRGALFIAVLSIRLRKIDVSPLVTEEDGSWKLQTSAPSPGWHEPDFDDSSWTSMERGELHEPEGQFSQLIVDRLAKLGAVALGPPPSTRRRRWFGKTDCWIRRRFEVADRGIS